MPFTLVIEPRALADIQKGIDYYDEQLPGLGERFNAAVSLHMNAIAINPFYQVRYKDYRALPIKNFPFIIVFYINEANQTAYITAVFNTWQNTEKLPL
jgi:hypothetical protein